MGAFYPLLLLRPLEAGSLGAGDLAAVAAVLPCLRQLCAEPQLLVDVFVNYDCEMRAPNLYERTVQVGCPAGMAGGVCVCGRGRPTGRVGCGRGWAPAWQWWRNKRATMAQRDGQVRTACAPVLPLSTAVPFCSCAAPHPRADPPPSAQPGAVGDLPCLRPL